VPALGGPGAVHTKVAQALPRGHDLDKAGTSGNHSMPPDFRRKVVSHIVELNMMCTRSLVITLVLADVREGDSGADG
jgi:hypothetical protein